MENEYSNKVRDFYNLFYKQSIKKNNYYKKTKQNFFKFQIPPKQKILEIGCGNGDLIAALNPKVGVGLDISSEAIKRAKNKHRGIKFLAGSLKKLKGSKSFDYIVLTDVVGELEDIQTTFEELSRFTDNNTRIIITFYNFLWGPLLKIAEYLKLKALSPYQNWLSNNDLENILKLVGYEVVKKDFLLLCPISIPVISLLLNRYLAKLPIIRNLCLVQCLIIKKNSYSFANKEYSVSVIVPARNEAGNIESLVLRLPKLGRSQEVIFIEGHSKDNTLAEIQRVIKKYKFKRNIQLIKQKGVGKADAVRAGFSKAKGEVLMILDADLSVKPEELNKFYQAIRQNQGDLIMGTRLVYPMEKDAMRFLNILGNKFFSLAFSWLLDQNIKDTLCGTKVISKKNYLRIAANRKYFGDFDPFGDFDLIFGASKLNLKIIEIPIRYMARTYGQTNINRFRHGLLLLKMTLIAAKKIKFI